MEELENAFSIDRVSKSGGVFDTEKLNWVNIHSTNEYLKQEIYETLVQFRCDQNILGDLATETYWN